MLVILERSCSRADRDRVVEAIRERGYDALPVPGRDRTAICVTGNPSALPEGSFRALPGVLEVLRVTRPFKLVSREVSPADTVVRVGEVEIGGACPPVLVAGPCSVESQDRTLEIARAVAAAGARVFRGGAFKPRTSPYSFQGLGRRGLEILSRVRAETGLPVVSEVIDRESATMGARCLDMLQVGARNMQNYSLLKCVGRLGMPVLLKRGPAASLEEWLMAAEYLLAEGNTQVILCERGIRTFSDHARNTLDLAVLPEVRRLSHLPVIADPSHGVGDRARVRPLGRAALAAGAHGLLIETHTDPDRATSDSAQTIDPATLAGLSRDLDRLRDLEPLDPASAARVTPRRRRPRTRAP